MLFTQITLLSSSPKETLLWKVSFAQITLLKEEFALFLLFKSVIRASYTFQLFARQSATLKSRIWPNYTFQKCKLRKSHLLRPFFLLLCLACTLRYFIPNFRSAPHTHIYRYTIRRLKMNGIYRTIAVQISTCRWWC